MYIQISPHNLSIYYEAHTGVGVRVTETKDHLKKTFIFDTSICFLKVLTSSYLWIPKIIQEESIVGESLLNDKTDQGPMYW